jgi:uncharacterized protein (TIGR03435 family)
MTRTTKIVLTSVAAVILIATVVAVKLIFFPSIKEAYFTMNNGNNRSLQKVPANLVVVRPTHFANSTHKGISYVSSQSNGRNVRRMMGRNVPLRDVIAVAYGQSPSRVVLPLDAPKGNYDFLVTVTDNPEGRLQSAIRRKLGYTAQMETRDTDVLALKVEDPNSPGLKASGADERDNTSFKDGKLYFTHQRLTVVTDGLEQMIKSPVVDKTGLTNYYDFSLVWNQQMQRQIQNGTMDQATGQKILADWGLGLEPDTAPLEVLVVKKVY